MILKMLPELKSSKRTIYLNYWLLVVHTNAPCWKLIFTGFNSIYKKVNLIVVVNKSYPKLKMEYGTKGTICSNFMDKIIGLIVQLEGKINEVSKCPK